MRSKQIGYEVLPEKLLSVEVKVVSQQIYLIREEYARDRAAGTAVVACSEISFRILVHGPSNNIGLLDVLFSALSTALDHGPDRNSPQSLVHELGPYQFLFTVG